MEHFTNSARADRSAENRKLTGMFGNRRSTEWAYRTLHDRGYLEDDINLVMSDDTRKKHFSDEEIKGTEIGSKAAEHACKGSAVAAIGTSVLIPGLGILIAGPITAELAGAGAGGIAGGVIGALVCSGIPEARAELYEWGIKEGNVVISVTPMNEEDAEYLEIDWKTHGGQAIYR